MDNKPSNKLEDEVKPAAGVTELSGGITASDDSNLPAKQSFFHRLISVADKYFLVFLFLILIGGIITYTGLSRARKEAPKTPTATSLTDQQLSQLKGSTTIVGDSDQTLDIQGNSVFEGPVLARGNLDVAGTIKVGGALSLPSLNVGGNANFGATQINGTFAVTGNSTFQGLVSIQKNLTVSGTGSFGTLSASQLNVSSLQFTGDLGLTHHLVTSGNTPSKTNGGALGSGGTASVSGNDSAGTVTINTGSAPPAGCFVTVGFSQKFASAPHVIISPSNSSAGSIDYYTNRTTTSFSICDVGVPAIGTTYIFDYFVAG